MPFERGTRPQVKQAEERPIWKPDSTYFSVTLDSDGYTTSFTGFAEGSNFGDRSNPYACLNCKVEEDGDQFELACQCPQMLPKVCIDSNSETDEWFNMAIKTADNPDGGPSNSKWQRLKLPSTPVSVFAERYMGGGTRCSELLNSGKPCPYLACDVAPDCHKDNADKDVTCYDYDENSGGTTFKVCTSCNAWQSCDPLSSVETHWYETGGNQNPSLNLSGQHCPPKEPSCNRAALTGPGCFVSLLIDDEAEIARKREDGLSLVHAQMLQGGPGVPTTATASGIAASTYTVPTGYTKM